MDKYEPQKFEKKWAEEWERSGIYSPKDSGERKYYALMEFPYPSGDGLHVGHVRGFTAMDIVARKRRMQGFNVLYPIGWDAFGLPTENYAIKTGIPPQEATKKNTDTFRRQFKSLGYSFDWSREINTTDPEYYKWTQWMFLKFFEAGLAYKAKTYINWCPKDKIGLANEEAAGGVCERCGGPVEKREKEQWMIRITKYADKLLEGLKEVDYIPQAKIQQENWIGKSEGAEIKFQVTSNKSQMGKVEVFTTRPDTIFGATYLVLAPEHKLISRLKAQVSNWDEVQKYIAEAKIKPEEERAAANKEKTGVELKGVKAINPATKEEIPIWVADYVLTGYGTGAIMAVPAHDERDFTFAKKYNLPIKQVICQNYPEKICPILDGAYTEEGHLVGSGKFDGMRSEDARPKMAKKFGTVKTQYKLRDWVFSRQRYWGEPIPLIFCPNCKKSAEMTNDQFPMTNAGWIPVPEKDLPVELPKVEKYQPTDTGESPLANIKEWVNVSCPKCKGPARRETDVMPNWAGSSWYFLRYVDPKNNKEFASMKKLKYWMGPSKKLNASPPATPEQARLAMAGGVDWYNGGMEHTVLHLLYSRFWNMFLYDQGLVPTAEPYKKRTSHGLILAEGGVKMSKSKGNVVNPDGLVKEFGADALRLYEMFIGPFDQAVAWDSHGILGTERFLRRVWTIGTTKVLYQHSAQLENKKKRGAGSSSNLSELTNEHLEKELHKLIKKVSEDIEAMSFNTAVSAMMVFINELINSKSHVARETWKTFLKILAPFAPFTTEELWQKMQAASGEKQASSIHTEPWPKHDEALIQEKTFELVIQVGGRTRGKILVPRGVSESEAKALAEKEVEKWIKGKIKKVIFVPDRLINFVE